MPKLRKVSAEEHELINSKITLTVGEAAIYLGIAEDKVRELVHTKDFPCFKNGNKWLINRAMLSDWVTKISIEHREI